MKLYKFSWAEIILPAVSMLVVIITFEVTSGFYLVTNPFSGDAKKRKYVNSADRSYYYYDKIIGEDGANAANSFGFLGPEPDTVHSRTTILLIGDSMPIIIGDSLSYAKSPANFPNIAKDLYNRGRRSAGQIELMNASISGYSLEQMKRFYTEKLQEFPHDLLIVSFFVDDIIRELSYRKNHIRYNPMWPEWMQDTYFNCVLCRLILNFINFTDMVFQTTGEKSYEKYFPAALNILDEIRKSAETRGVKIAVINLPLLTAISDSREYRYMEMNRVLNDWCRKMKIPYHDVLPSLIGQDINQLTVDGVHFNELGHEIVGVDLNVFIQSLVSSCCG